MQDIVRYPHPTLLKEATPVELNEAGLELARRISAKLWRNLNGTEHGIGLAAPQVDESHRVAILKMSGINITMVNPTISKRSKNTFPSHEACLSVKGQATVTRHKSVKVVYYDLDGVQRTVKGRGLMSACLQHELDHLDGITLKNRRDNQRGL